MARLHHPKLHPTALDFDENTPAGARGARIKRRQGWVDAPAGTDTEPAPVGHGLDELDKDGLLAFAASNGIDVNTRLGEAKLRAAIAAALDTKDS